MARRGLTVGAVAVVAALLASSCTSGTGKSAATTTAPSAALTGFAQRARDYLVGAAAVDVAGAGSQTKVWHAVAELAADPNGTKPVGLTVADLTEIADRFANFEDTTDFDLVALLNLWFRSGRGKRLAPATRDDVKKLILGFKYWYDEPQPAGKVDERWYWSENHQILYHSIELLAGEAFPGDTFTISGTTGRRHVAHAKPLVQKWVTQRAKYGFSEWYSNVYYEEDLEATVSLAEFATDHDIATLGSIATDMVLYDIASHTFQGAFGATHGRTYKKDKMTALDEDTWDVSKLVLDDATLPYQSKLAAVYLASATRYRPPAVLESVVRDVGVERARHSLPIDPLAPITPNPPGPDGLAFDDHDNLMLWWGMGALTPWQTVVDTTNEMTKYNLWDTQLFSDFKPFEPIAKAASPDVLRSLARSLAPELNIGLLSEANTYTWRSKYGMLSTVQDFRKGQASQQHHVWQATLSPEAQVFTTHPRTPTEPGVPWHSNTDDWTGNASLPRSAQIGDVNISIYAPLFASKQVLQGSYQPYTHAYFPQDHFDEVQSDGNWTFGQLGKAYIALYSWRTPHWVTYDPAKYDVNGLKKPFELVADGGPNNVWITKLGSEPVDGSFDAFRAAIVAHPPVVTPLGDPALYSTGFDVTWESPTEGTLAFGWDKPLTFDHEGSSTPQVVPLTGYPRIDSPWAKVAFGSAAYTIKAGKESLRFDVRKPSRVSSSNA